MAILKIISFKNIQGLILFMISILSVKRGTGVFKNCIENFKHSKKSALDIIHFIRDLSYSIGLFLTPVVFSKNM